jgi:hypothetical protein
MNRRRIEALRNLAERPGTPAEGALAREILERHEGKQSQRSQNDAFCDYLRSGERSDLDHACYTSTCRCGNVYPRKNDRESDCPMTDRHALILAEKLKRFPRGTRVYYNYWAYGENCLGTVTGPSKDWAWLRIKFDNLKQARKCPIYSEFGWHLSIEPLTGDTRKLRGIL